MFRPQIQKTWVVLFVSMFSIIMIYFALGNITYHETVGFNNKKVATQIMEEALLVLKKKVKNIYPDVADFNTFVVFQGVAGRVHSIFVTGFARHAPKRPMWVILKNTFLSSHFVKTKDMFSIEGYCEGIRYHGPDQRPRRFQACSRQRFWLPKKAQNSNPSISHF